MKKGEETTTMKHLAFAIVAICAMAAGAAAQSSIFDRYDVNMTKWAQLPAGTEWGGETSMVAADGKGQVAVILRVAPHIRIFTTDGKFVKSWGNQGTFGMAHSVHFDRDGNLWVADPIWHVVQKFNADGKLLMTLGKLKAAGDNASRDAFNQPNFVAFGANGDVFVSDGYINSRIVQFNKDGQFVRIFGGTKGGAPGQLTLPHGVAVDSRGRVLVSDSDNKRISVFDKEGKFLETWAAPSRGGIAVDREDTVYVSDVNGGAVTILKEGRIVDVIKVDGRPHGLAVDPATLDVYTASSVKTSPNITKASPKKAATTAAR
jgi:DNA-binding beta-propeller fold protein YncE